MPLELKSGSRWWYGRVQVNGKRALIRLGVPVRGKRPASLREEGDPPFEISRALAQSKLDEKERTLRETGNEQFLTERLLFLKQGVRPERIALRDMFHAWVALSPGKIRSARYLSQIKSLCTKFANFAGMRQPPATEMAQVSGVLAADFVRSIEAEGVTAKTRNERTKTLKTIFKDLSPKAGIARNPFEGIKKLEEIDSVFRDALTIDQMAAVLRAAEADPFIRPLIVVAICTALRRIDCCLLTYKRINWPRRMICVKPAKRGKQVDIPIFGLLEVELGPLFDGTTPNPNAYVFPAQAQMFLTNPDGITLRAKRVMQSAGFAWDDDDSAAHEPALSVKRVRGKRRASVFGFQSLRATWVTIALVGGVPMELVKKITGHHTAEIIERHYLKPGFAQLRDALTAKLPQLLVNRSGEHSNTVSASAIDAHNPAALLARLRGLLASMTQSNWHEVRDQALAELAQE